MIYTGYEFKIPTRFDEAISIIENTLISIGWKFKRKNELIFKASCKYKLNIIRFEILVIPDDNYCLVKVNYKEEPNVLMPKLHIRTKKTDSDICWEQFVVAITSNYPNYDFKLLPGDLHITEIVYLSDGIKEMFVSTIFVNPNGGVFRPNAVSAGAVSTYQTNKLDIIVRYSNGYLDTGYVKRYGKTHAELLVKLNKSEITDY